MFMFMCLFQIREDGDFQGIKDPEELKSPQLKLQGLIYRSEAFQLIKHQAQTTQTETGEAAVEIFMSPCSGESLEAWQKARQVLFLRKARTYEMTTDLQTFDRGLSSCTTHS